jgi:hypothetical protein
VRVSVEALPALRRQPGPVTGEPLPSAFLRHADEQTVVGLTAVYQAIHDHQLPASFRAWGVVAAPRFIGRPAMAGSLERYPIEGAWGVSPHMIPHRSLHSISGTVSQALKIHGPNFGVGGGPGGEAEVLLTAASLLYARKLPGIWMVLTRLDPELSPAPGGVPAEGSFVQGMALALVPVSPATALAGAEGRTVRLRLVAGLPSVRAMGTEDVPFAERFTFDTLLEFLRRASQGETPLTHTLGAGMQLELRSPRISENPGPVYRPDPWLRRSA